MKTIRTFATVAVIAAAARPAAAQNPEASAAGFGMGGNYSAVARGFDAVAFNPANLGLSGNPAFSLSLFSFGVSTGIDPVKLSDFKPYGGKVIPSSVKESWLTQIGSGREQGSTDAGISLVALSIRNVGFQVGVIGAGDVNVNQDAAEAILFGNAGRTPGVPRNFSFNGSSASGGAFGVGAVSVGIPIASDDQGGHTAIGFTGKYIMGLAGGRAMDNGSTITPDNIAAQFPMIYTPSAGNAGSGIGLDVGLSWGDARTTLSAAARNVVNTFAWSTDAFRSRPGTVTFDGNTSPKGNFDEAPYLSAPAALRTALEDEKFKPELAVGLARRVNSTLLVSADASDRIGDGIEIGPKMHVGVGAEFTGIPMLALRGGVAAITDGYQAAAGVGIHIGSVEIGAGVMTRSRNSGQELGAMFNLISIH
jgi:hypothetical protein